MPACSVGLARVSHGALPALHAVLCAPLGHPLCIPSTSLMHGYPGRRGLGALVSGFLPLARVLGVASEMPAGRSAGFGLQASSRNLLQAKACAPSGGYQIRGPGCLLALFLVCILPQTGGWAASMPAAAIIDDCQYADDDAASALWEPMRGSAGASMALLEGRKVLRLPCNFAGTKIERASWDRKVNLNLSSCRGVQFRMLCHDPSPVVARTI